MILGIYEKDNKKFVAKLKIDDMKLFQAVQEAMERPSQQISNGPFKVMLFPVEHQTLKVDKRHGPLG